MTWTHRTTTGSQKILTEDHYSWVVRCWDEDTKKKALAMDGLSLGGVTYSVCKYEHRLTGEEIFNMVESRLKRDKEVDYHLRTRGDKKDKGPKGSKDITMVSQTELRWITVSPQAICLI